MQQPFITGATSSESSEWADVGNTGVEVLYYVASVKGSHLGGARGACHGGDRPVRTGVR